MAIIKGKDKASKLQPYKYHFYSDGVQVICKDNRGKSDIYAHAKSAEHAKIIAYVLTRNIPENSRL